MVQAVLVGCGAMSKVWLDAARQTEGVAIVGLVDVDVSGYVENLRVNGVDVTEFVSAELDRRHGTSGLAEKAARTT